LVERNHEVNRLINSSNYNQFDLSFITEDTTYVGNSHLQRLQSIDQIWNIQALSRSEKVTT
jgi:hypothetical protein